ncbi:MAG: hypothetical protein AAB394_03475 [Patescibacteria group bacterium]
MEVLKVFGFIFLFALVVSCNDLDSKVKDLELKLDEAVALADSINTEYKLMDEMFKTQEIFILSLRDSIFNLTRDNIFLKAENSKLRLELLANKKVVVDKSKNEKSLAVVSGVSKPDTISKKLPVIPPDSVATPPDTSSFISYIWEKRSRVEP